MHDRCVDCNTRPTLNDVVPCYSETFPMKAADGGVFQFTLRLGLECGTRFRDRKQLREYLRAKLPSLVRAAEVPAA